MNPGVPLALVALVGLTLRLQEGAGADSYPEAGILATVGRLALELLAIVAVGAVAWWLFRGRRRRRW